MLSFTVNKDLDNLKSISKKICLAGLDQLGEKDITLNNCGYIFDDIAMRSNSNVLFYIKLKVPDTLLADYKKLNNVGKHLFSSLSEQQKSRYKLVYVSQVGKQNGYVLLKFDYTVKVR